MAEMFDQTQYEIRAYSGDSPTPFYVVLTNYQLPSLPGNAPLPPEEIRAGGQKIAANNVFAVIPDETPGFAAQDFTLEIDMVDTEVKVLDALGNPEGGTWTVGGDTWGPILQANIGTRVDAAGVAQAAVYPKHASRRNFLFNLEERLGTGGSARFKKLIGVGLTSWNTSVQAGNIRWTFNLSWYGGIEYPAAFTTGTES